MPPWRASNIVDGDDNTLAGGMMLIARGVCIAAISLALQGCDKIDTAISEKIEKVMSSVNERISKAESRLTALEQKSQWLEIYNNIQDQNINSNIVSDAAISTDDRTFGLARTPYGSLPILVDKLEPHLDGIKARIWVGNMSSASLNGAEVTVKWGAPWDKKQDYKEWEKTQKEKIIKPQASFFPASYTLVDAILAPAKPEEVREIKVGVNFTGISLRKPQ